MTDMGVKQMTDENGRTAIIRVTIIVLCCLAIIFLLGVAGGFIAVQIENNEGIGAQSAAILAGLGLLSAGTIGVLARMLNTNTDAEPPTAKERLNRNMLIGCGLLGGLMGAALQAFGGPDAIFSNDSLSPVFAIALVLVTGGLLPVVSWYWHRHATDEQEAEAYKLGALGGIYVYMIGAPSWWFLWRGGLAPKPDGIAIYFITVFTVGLIWLWRKYR